MDFLVKWPVDVSCISGALPPDMDVTFGGKFSHSVHRIEIKNLGNYCMCV